MEENNIYKLKVREKLVINDKEYDEINYNIFIGTSTTERYENESIISPSGNSSVGPPSVGIPNAISSPPPLSSKAPVPRGTAIPHPLTYCLIKPHTSPNKCLSVAQLVPGDPLSSHVAVLSPISSVPFTDGAYKQSWEICWLPSDNACNLRNKYKHFLKISTVDNSTPPTIDVGVGGGEAHEDCFWELVKDSGSLPTVTNTYKIRNVRTLQYLMANTTTNQVDPTLDDTEATIWDFQISGTVPP